MKTHSIVYKNNSQDCSFIKSAGNAEWPTYNSVFFKSKAIEVLRVQQFCHKSMHYAAIIPVRE